MLAPVTDKVQGKGGDQVWLNQLLLHVPVLLLPLPFLTSSLTVHITPGQHSGQRGKGAIPSSDSLYRVKTSFTRISLKTYPFLSQFLWSEKCHLPVGYSLGS